MVSSTIGGVATAYTYDGDGRRVQKTTGTATTDYVYDAQGQLAAEYATQPTPMPCSTCYLTADTLGSTRMVTDGNGNVQSFADYLPSGEEIQSGVGNRSALYYPPSDLAVADGVTQKFTGKERDGETGIDYFGARYFSAAQGRWTSPDWSERPEPIPYANLGDPQSLNLYGYVHDNPLLAPDPDGHGCEADAGGDTKKWMACKGVSSQITGYTVEVVAQVVKDTVVGGVKGAANQVIDAANTTNNAVNSMLSLTPISYRFQPIPEFESSTPGQKSAMAGVFIVSLFFGAGEEETAAKIGTITADAEKLYPKLVGKLNNHHIVPKYLGGAADGATVSIPAAYHQMITNEFRRLAPYGQKVQRSAAEVERILQQVYSKYPLPLGKP